MSTTEHPCWQGTPDQLAESNQAELLRTPIFILRMGPYHRRGRERQATRRVRQAGAVLTNLFGGKFTFETSTVNFGTHSSEHVDGKVSPYIQLHVARPREEGRIGASRFVMRTYAFAEGMTVHDYMPRSKFESREGEYSNSIVIQPIQPPYSDISLSAHMHQKGAQLPNASSTFQADVQYGDVAVFINGFGFDSTFTSHEISSVRPDGSPSADARLVTLGRIVGSSLLKTSA